jgi:protection of telomeres protein 1
VSLVHSILNHPYLSNEMPDGTVTQFPFLNLKCRLCIRVIDYFPSQLEDFSRILDSSSSRRNGANTEESTTESDDTDLSSDSSISTEKWKWAFFLLVEDALAPSAPSGPPPARIPLLVAEDDAVHLLKLDAADLRRDASTLAQLREKLFILWGNLEEVKAGREATHSSKPFECCVKEYGVKENGQWRRIHRIFGTTIKS